MKRQGLIYFQDGTLVAASGNAKVYEMNEELFLEIGPGNTLWALESEIGDYMDQLGDKPHGKVLEIGLGLGVASRYLLSCPNVESLTTVEINSDVVDVFHKIAPIMRTFKDDLQYFSHKRHLILNVDGILYTYQTDMKYDFVFIDCYDRIDEDTLPFISDLVRGCKNILKDKGEIVGWFDKYTPDEYTDRFIDIFK